MNGERREKKKDKKWNFSLKVNFIFRGFNYINSITKTTTTTTIGIVKKNSKNIFIWERIKKKALIIFVFVMLLCWVCCNMRLVLRA